MPDDPGDSVDPLDPVALLEVLVRHQVRFVVIGGIAAISQGYPLPTEDVDVTPSRDRENLERLAGALRELDARLRTASDPTGVPFPIDADMLREGSRGHCAHGSAISMSSSLPPERRASMISAAMPRSPIWGPRDLSPCSSPRSPT